MSLDTLQLDDLQWADLTTSARERIAGASGGQWTHHAPVDPGVTLLELYASQLEQRMYWMDQPSDELKVALLKLLGFKPRWEACAKTVLMLITGQDEIDETENVSCVRIRRGCVFRTALETADYHFSTSRPIHVLPVVDIPHVTTQQRRRRMNTERNLVSLQWQKRSQLVRDLSRELARRQAPAIFQPNSIHAKSVVSIPLQTRPMSNDKVLIASVLFDLATPRGVQPQWDATKSIGTRISNNPVQWSVSLRVGEDTSIPLKTKHIIDGTNGLSRSGIVTFHILTSSLPTEPLANGQVNDAFEIRIGADSRSFPFAPRVRQIVPNAVVAEHRMRLQVDPSKLDEQISRWNKLPGNRISLHVPKNQKLLACPESIIVLLNEQRPSNRCHQWHLTKSFAQHGPQDRVVVVDPSRHEIVFGDGLHGRIPVISTTSKLPRAVVTYELGGGAKGNLPGNLNWKSDELNVTGINVVKGVGGRDADTIARAVHRVRTIRKQPHRSITRSDIEQLAVETPGAGIARAHAEIGFHPEYPSVVTPGAVSVFLVPDLPDEVKPSVFIRENVPEDLVRLIPSPRMLKSAADWLESKRPITQEIFVCPPAYQQVELEVSLDGQPFDLETTHQLIWLQLATYLHPLYGGPAGNGWRFGDPLRPAELMQQAQAAVPDLRVTGIGVRLLEQLWCDSGSIAAHREPQPNSFEYCHDLKIGDRSLVALRNVSLVMLQSQSMGGLQ